MADKHRPRRGSMGFSPRKRANRPYGTITAWPDVSADSIRVQGFAGWKAGMTHVLVQNTNPTSTSAGQEVRRAVTVVETPPMKVLGVRGYVMDPYGLRTAGEVWCEPDDLQAESPRDWPMQLVEKEMLLRAGSQPSELAEYPRGLQDSIRQPMMHSLRANSSKFE